MEQKVCLINNAVVWSLTGPSKANGEPSADGSAEKLVWKTIRVQVTYFQAASASWFSEPGKQPASSSQRSLHPALSDQSKH
jgi:hypothetical protein